MTHKNGKLTGCIAIHDFLMIGGLDRSFDDLRSCLFAGVSVKTLYRDLSEAQQNCCLASGPKIAQRMYHTKYVRVSLAATTIVIEQNAVCQ